MWVGLKEKRKKKKDSGRQKIIGKKDISIKEVVMTNEYDFV